MDSLRVELRRPTIGPIAFPFYYGWVNLAIAALAMVTTVVPGTVWSELALDRAAVMLHVWDVDDEAAFVARYKARYEKPLQEIFE